MPSFALIMKTKLAAVFSLFLLFLSNPIFASENYQDFFRSTGKINTVLAVVVILFVVLIIFLIRLERKVKQLENKINDE